jgi:hypothetical protein
MKEILKRYKPSRAPIIKRFLFIFSGTCCIVFFALLFSPRPYHKNGFKNLSDIQTYAQSHDENIKLDTENTIKPDFSSYYKTLESNWRKNLHEKIIKLFSFVGLARTPIWSASFFKTQLEDLAKTSQFKDSFICKLSPTLDSKIVLFGNIQGAFHSLTRNLIKLKELGIINNELKVTSPQYFIVFIGDVINRSPYTMETLSLVMKLKQINKDNIIYLRGNHESGNYWQEHVLKTELQTRANHLDTRTIPLEDQVNAFFNTLPLAVYIAMPGKNGAEFIRISDTGRRVTDAGQYNELINESNYAQFLATKSAGTYSCLNLKENSTQKAGPTIDIKVIFKGERKRESYQPHEGLRQLPPDLGSTAWTVLSCPTPVYQKAIRFKHDAFVIITPANTVDEWKLTLYNRNVQTKEPFAATTYNLLSGAADGHATTPAKQTSTTTPTEKVSQSPVQKQEKPQPTSSAFETITTTTPQPEPVSQQSAPTTQPVQQAPKKPDQTIATTDTTVTSTIDAINKHAQEIAQHAQEIAKKVQEINKTPESKQAPVVESKSAFEPIN